MIPPESAEHTVVRTYLDWLVSCRGAASTEDNLDIAQCPRRCSTKTTTTWRRSRSAFSNYLAVRKLKRTSQGADPVLRRTSRSRQDVAGHVDRARAGTQVRAAVAGRRTRRGRNPRPPTDLHRRAARANHPGHCARPGPATRCSSWTRLTSWALDFRGDPASALLEVLDPEQNNDLRRPLPRRAVRSVEGLVPDHGERARHRPAARCATAWRCSNCRATPNEEKAADRAALSDSESRCRRTAWANEQHRVSASKRCASSFAATRARPACGTWSARSRRSAARVAHARSTEGESEAPERDRPRKRCDELPAGAEVLLRDGRAHQANRAWRPDWPGPQRRRHPVHRGTRMTGQKAAAADRAARRRDEGIGAGGAVLYALAAPSAWASPGVFRRRPTFTSMCRRGRSPRTVRRRASRHRGLAGLAAHGRPVRPRRGDDRRDHAARQGAAGGRHQGKGAGGAAGGN